MPGSKREIYKETRREKMIVAASQIYSEYGIDSTTIQQVADRAELGVASVYRYFPGKTDLAVAAAIHVWKNAMVPLSEGIAKEENPWECIKNYMNGFLHLFRNTPDFFRFVENFDNYISRQENRPESIREYEIMLTAEDNQIMNILHKGQEQGFIRSDIEIDHYYSVATKAIMAFAQKLLLRGSILEADKTDHIKEMTTLISILLDNIRKR
jgi:AcrR family transcriptional regulator